MEEKRYVTENNDINLEKFDSNNTINLILKIIGYIIIVGGLILGYNSISNLISGGFVDRLTYLYYFGQGIFSFLIFSFGFVFVGIGEIIKLLQGIYNWQTK